MKNKNKKIVISTIVVLALSLNFYSISFFTHKSPEESKIHLSTQQNNAAQGVVDYFRQVFVNDWKIGEEYDPVEDGIGKPQSRDRYGSSYEPFESNAITDDMRITPILSPDNSEDLLIELINGATSTLDIEQMYIYSSLTDIITAIVNANDRGVSVRVILADDEDSKEAADAFISSGIPVKICTGTVPMYFFQHNKGVIVDGEKVLICSINWSPTSIRDNREAGLIIESNEVALYYQNLFDHDWSVCEDYDDSTHLHDSSSNQKISTSELKLTSYSSDFSTKTFEGQMDVTAMASPDNCYAVVSNLLDNAETNIYIAVYTLSSPYLIDILADKISLGIDVRLLLDSYQVGYYERMYNRWTMYSLTTQGVPSIEDASVNNTAKGLWNSDDFTFQHCKYCIIDNKTLIISSGNWARSSCPKPQDDGDVDGNRDWWIAIHGSGDSGDITNGDENGDFDLDDLLSISGFHPILIIGIIGVVVIIIIKKQH